eukprot:5734136-Prymnesium_polylepis.1
MVRYVLRAGGLAEPSCGWLGVPADRWPRGVALARLAEWSVLSWVDTIRRRCPGSCPRGCTSTRPCSSGAHHSAGRACCNSSRRNRASTAVARGHQTSGRPIMKVRAVLFHTPAEPRLGGCR